MTFQEIMNAHAGYTDRQIEGWKRTRWLATIVANIAGNEKTPSDLMKLPGDGEVTSFESEIDRLKEMRKWQIGQ